MPHITPTDRDHWIAAFEHRETLRAADTLASDDVSFIRLLHRRGFSEGFINDLLDLSGLDDDTKTRLIALRRRPADTLAEYCHSLGMARLAVDEKDECHS